MHTFVAGKSDADFATTFNFNGDLSGNVQITDCRGARTTVPGAHILEFVADWVRTQRISSLEDASTEEVLGIVRQQE